MTCKKSSFSLIKLYSRVIDMNQRGAPVFVKVDSYKEIIDVLGMIKDKVKEIHETLGSIESLKHEEDAEIEAWRRTVNEIEKKIEGIDKMMFEPHGW